MNKRKLTPTRYICENTLSTLGLKVEIDIMFHSIRLLDFMHRETPAYEHITLKFFSTLEFKLLKKWIDGMRYYYGTLMFNANYELSMEDFR